MGARAYPGRARVHVVSGWGAGRPRWVRPGWCSGGCAANAFYAADSILGVYEYGCKLFKKRIECAIMMKVAEAIDD